MIMTNTRAQICQCSLAAGKALSTSTSLFNTSLNATPKMTKTTNLMKNPIKISTK